MASDRFDFFHLARTAVGYGVEALRTNDGARAEELRQRAGQAEERLVAFLIAHKVSDASETRVEHAARNLVHHLTRWEFGDVVALNEVHVDFALLSALTAVPDWPPRRGGAPDTASNGVRARRR